MDPIEAAKKRREYFTVVESDDPNCWTLAFRASDDGTTLVREVSLEELESIHFELTSAIHLARFEIERRAHAEGYFPALGDQHSGGSSDQTE